MTAEQILALLPMILVTLTCVLVMLATAFFPGHQLSNRLTLAGLVLTFASLFWIADLLPQQVTPLIIMDRFALFYSGLILASGAAITVFSLGYFAASDTQQAYANASEFYILLLAAILGGIVLVSSSHFGSFFIGLELLGVSIYVLVAYLGQAKRGRSTSLEAGIKYLILSGVASAILLFGIALLYAEFGALGFEQLGAIWKVDVAREHLFAAAGLGLVVAGICFKLSLVPFHMWTPDVYEGAPAPAAAFVATVSKGAIFAFMLRFFDATGIFNNDLLLLGMGCIAIASMLGGNLLALLQTNVKRILAYSSIAHIGYLMVAFLAGGAGTVPTGVIGEAIGFYLVAYFVTTLGAFGVICVLSSMNGHRDMDRINEYKGLFWRAPWLATVMTAMLLSLAGIPLTVGFIGKFYVFSVGAQGLMWWLLAALILGSAIGLYYYLRLIIVMFMRSDDQLGDTNPLELSISAGDALVLGSLMAALLWIGVYPQPLIELIQSVALG